MGKRVIFRWTVGPVSSLGLKCLWHSLSSIIPRYNAEFYLYYNCEKQALPSFVYQLPLQLVDQTTETYAIKPIGVAWKLYPPRIDLNSYELNIDNDIVLNDRIDQIDQFLDGDHTLLLEDWSRTYGRFEKHVPPEFRINSGLYGMPPGFDLDAYLKFFVNQPWENNAKGEYAASQTFDEQGLIALALLGYKKFVIIPNTIITNCERQYVPGLGHHFIGVNRNSKHLPFRLYLMNKQRFLL